MTRRAGQISHLTIEDAWKDVPYGYYKVRKYYHDGSSWPIANIDCDLSGDVVVAVAQQLAEHLNVALVSLVAALRVQDKRSR